MRTQDTMEGLRTGIMLGFPDVISTRARRLGLSAKAADFMMGGWMRCTLPKRSVSHFIQTMSRCGSHLASFFFLQ